MPSRGCRRPREPWCLLRERGPLHPRRDEDERTLGRVPPLAVELEHGAAPGDEIELFVLVVGLVVLVDDPVADASRGPRVDPERRDTQVVAHGPPRLAPVADLVDLLEVDDCVIAHEGPLGSFLRLARTFYTSRTCSPRTSVGNSCEEPTTGPEVSRRGRSPRPLTAPDPVAGSFGSR